MDNIIDAFNYIEDVPILPPTGMVAGQSQLNNVRTLQIGNGSQAFHGDQQGIWLGAEEFADAPFGVDMQGALRAKSATFVDGNDITIVDASGLVSTANFNTGNANASPSTAFTTTSYVAVSGSDLTFILSRSTRVLVLLTIQSGHEQTTGGSNMSGRVFYTIHADNVAKLPEILIDTDLNDATGIRENVFRKVYSTSMLLTLATGSHTINARYKIDSASNITATLYTWNLTYVILGN